ncbi:MAG: YqaA family protein [Alphaproteobacteria bacterium]
MLRRLYDRTLALAGHRRARWALAAVSFVESSVFPIPPDVLLIPMVLADRRGAWRAAAVCTLASVLGGLLGYAIGALLFEAVGRVVLDAYGYADAFGEFRDAYTEWGIWIVAFAGFTPFPYKVITIASGVFGLDLATFVLASVASRGARFFLVAALLWRFGAPMRAFIERRLGLLALIFFLLLFGGFLVTRFAL